MKRVLFATLLVLSMLSFALVSCGTIPETAEPLVVETAVVEKPVEPPPKEEPTTEAPVAETSPAPAEEPAAEEAPAEEPATEATEQEPQPTEEAPADEPPEQDTPAAQPPEPVEEQPPDEFQVTEEIFTETFENIRTIIAELNGIIRDENYSRWIGYLAQEYIDHFSSPEILKENSEQPILKKYNVVLRSLKDYFTYVVVPSRSNARLDDLVFIDNDHLKAIMIISDRRTILYQLTKVDGVWKIGL